MVVAVSPTETILQEIKWTFVMNVVKGNVKKYAKRKTRTTP